ncbi:MCP four helix bundle domain-containing protein [Dokdonia genika]|uniref:MCP four helix bundle domain-containing protein n=1 Tax=Dokdonia genika TaxID=308113 RepID=A0ABV9L7K4_9FLAO
MNSKHKRDFKQKFNLAIALLVVFIIVIATNLVDKRHFNTAQETVTTIYEDRVVAQHYLFKMNSIIYQKEEQFLKKSATNTVIEEDATLEALMDKFSATKLTPAERENFESLQEHIAILHRIEDKYRNQSDASEQAIPKIFSKIKTDLNNLADIQMKEGENRLLSAKKSLSTTNFLSHLEIIIVIVVGIIVQFIIFQRVKTTSRKPGLRVE